MPQRDGTGPMGNGPMTGRRWGQCRNKFPKNDRKAWLLEQKELLNKELENL